MNEDKLESILPRRSEVMEEQMRLSLEIALKYIAEKLRRNSRSHTRIIIADGELEDRYRGTGSIPSTMNSPRLQWYISEAGYDIQINKNGHYEISWER